MSEPRKPSSGDEPSLPDVYPQPAAPGPGGAPGTHGKPGALDEATRDEMIRRVADQVVRRGLAVPAIFTLESCKPLSFVGSQVMVFFGPFVQTLFTFERYDQFVALMEDRANVERLLVEIERQEDERQRREAEEKKRRKEKERAERAAGKGKESMARRLLGRLRATFSGG